METEKFELMLDEAQANAALEKGMLYADTFVNKNYLINLDRYPLVELDSAEKSDEYIRLYQIERIVYDVDENANDKLISVYSAFFNIQAAGLLVIKSTRNALGFYIGVRSVDNTSTAEAILEKSFKGNFAGSQIQAIPQEEVQKVLGSINKSGRFGTRQNVSSVSIVPSTRDEDKERFVQGIEKFIDTMKGSEYTAVFIVEPLDKEILEQRKRGLQKIYSGLSPFASTQLSYGENYSKQDIVQSMVDWCSCFEREAPVNGTFAAKLAEFISCNGLFEALPIRFAKDYKNEPKITRDCIDKKDLASIRNWHSRVYDHLDSYVLLTDENIKNRVLRYLLLNKRVEEINYNKYQLIYEGIYGKARGNK